MRRTWLIAPTLTMVIAAAAVVLGVKQCSHVNSHPNALVPDGKYGQSPQIVIAARTNDKGRLEQLVAAGADVNTQSLLGRTALLTAITEGNYDLANFLLAHGADPNIVASNGEYALYTALKNYKNLNHDIDKTLDTLLSYKADPFLNSGLAIMFAANNNLSSHLEIIFRSLCPEDQVRAKELLMYKGETYSGDVMLILSKY